MAIRPVTAQNQRADFLWWIEGLDSDAAVRYLDRQIETLEKTQREVLIKLAAARTLQQDIRNTGVC